MLIMEFLVYIYVSHTVNVILHELGHYTIACILKLNVTEVVIGSKFLSIRLGKFRFSPLAFKGFVSVESDYHSFACVIAFFSAGIIGNGIALWISSIISLWPLKALIQLFAITQMIVSVIPFPDSDMSNMIKILRTI